MKRFIINCSVIVFFASMPLGSCFALSFSKNIQKGNNLYKKNKFDDALKYYNEAKKDYPDSAMVNFNIGTAWYKKENYKKAIDSFVKSLITDNIKLESKANYNIANSKYKMGRRKVNTDLEDAVKLYRESLDYYKRAIDLDHTNIDAKYNHEFVERELKVLLDKLKKRRQNQKKEVDKSRQKKTAKNNSSQQEKSVKGSKGKQNKKQSEGKKSILKKQQPPKGTAGKEEAVKKGRKPAEYKKEEDKKEMTEKEARMILKRYSYEEAPLNFDRKKTKAYYPSVEKDW